MDGTRARAVLGVSDHATADDLRHAFRRRARSTHPDHGGDAQHFDETMHAFRALVGTAAGTAPAMVVDAQSLRHTPVDCYDTVVPLRDASRRDRSRPAGPTFAEVLQRVTTTKLPAVV